MGAECSSQETVQEKDAKGRLQASMGTETTLALCELAAVLKIANKDLFNHQFNYPSVVNLGMLFSQCKREGRYQRPLMSGKKFVDGAVLIKASRYAAYARAAHCSVDQDILQTIDDAEFGGNVEILYVHKQPEAMSPLQRAASSPLRRQRSSSRFCPSFFIAADKGTGDIVLSIRGRATPEEEVRDIQLETINFMDGNTLKSHLLASEELIKNAREPLENALASSPSSTLAVVGHGFGAGVAILATLQGFGDGSAVEPLLAAGKAKCYAFGPPPIFEPVGNLPKERANAIYTFINGMDCMARASPATAGKLLLAIKAVDALRIDLQTRLSSLSGEVDDEDPEQKYPDHEDLTLSLTGDLRPLTCVGTTLLLLKDKDQRIGCEKLIGGGIERILIHENMFADHALSCYEDAISQVAMQRQGQKGCC